MKNQIRRYKECLILQFDGGIKNRKALHLWIEILPQMDIPTEMHHVKKDKYKMLICRGDSSNLHGKKTSCTSFLVMKEF